MNDIMILGHRGTGGQQGYIYSVDGVSPCIPSSTYKDPVKIVVGDNMEEKKMGNIYGFTGGNYAGNVYDASGVSPAINTCQGGNRQPIIPVKDKIKETIKKIARKWRIRKLTPTECFRLMGFKDKDVHNCRSVSVSNSALYKQAGNSIITNCVELLAEHLYKAQYDDKYECFDENFTKPQVGM